MRIQNISNKKADNTYELEVVGTEAQVEAYQEFTQFTADFIEEEEDGNFSITIMSCNSFSKKEFRQEVTQELKEFRSL